MLKTSVTLRLNCNLSLSEMNVNTIVALGQRSRLSKILVEESLMRYQQQALDQYLGPRHASSSKTQDIFRCPRCASMNFVRRGSRVRKLLTTLGQLHFRLYQITCLTCRMTFSPFGRLLDLHPRQRIAEELEYKLIGLAKDIGYHRSAQKLNLLTSVKISATTVHRIVQRRSSLLDFYTPSDPQIIIMDSTKINISPKKYHDDLNIAIGIESRYKKSNRYHNDKRILALNCAAPWFTLDRYLRKKQPSYILCDGDPELINLSERLYPQAVKQWCIWHLPRIVFKKTLWIDRLDYKKRAPWIERLKSILFDYASDPVILKERLNQYIQDALSARLEETARYLKANQEYFFNYKSQTIDSLKEDFSFTKPLVASGVIERLMREIKRRVKNGVRWTHRGVTNLLKIKLIAEYNPEQYQKIWTFVKEPTALDYLNVKIS